MELKHIDIASLVVSSANMRVKGKTPDLTNILPSVRAGPAHRAGEWDSRHL